jgi:5'-phosphate synthase pdxT subunit
MQVGVLAVQGDFEAHGRMLGRLGAETVYVRLPKHLENLSGLILPGGESTTMLKFLEDEGLFDALRTFAARRPLFGTCAGAILMASEVSHPSQRSLGLMEMSIERNAYGRQVDSHNAALLPSLDFVERAGGERAVDAVFIRAPIIRRLGPQVRVLLDHQGDPVLVEQDRHLAATFHPELTADTRVHELFLKKASQG